MPTEARIELMVDPGTWQEHDRHLESSDPLDKVCTFYKSKYPNAMVSTSGHNQCSIIANDDKNMTTIHLEPDGSNTKIQITKVSKSTGTSSN